MTHAKKGAENSPVLPHEMRHQVAPGKVTEALRGAEPSTSFLASDLFEETKREEDSTKPIQNRF